MVDIESGYDFLFVHDGADTSAALLDVISGPIHGQRFCSTSGCLTFRFFSDYSIQGAGWEAGISCYADCPQDSSYQMPGNRVNTCHGTFKDTGGDLDYQNFEDTVSTFCPSSTDSLLKVHFQFVDIESGYDYLYIHDGPTTAFPIMDSLDGQFVNIEYISTQGCLTFHFISDFSVTRPGWEGSISCIADTSLDVGLVEVTQLLAFKVYPNPAERTVWLDLPTEHRPEGILLYDLRGQLVLRPERSNGAIDVGRLPNGSYILEVHIKDQILREQLVISR